MIWFSFLPGLGREQLARTFIPKTQAAPAGSQKRRSGRTDSAAAKAVAKAKSKAKAKPKAAANK